MTTASSFGDSDPRVELSLSRGLARRVRREQRATWFPLAVFAVVTLLAIPVTRAGHAVGLDCRTLAVAEPPVARACVAHNSAAYVYWPIALIVSYVLIAAFFLFLSRRRGLAARVVPYVVVGVVLAAAVTAASIWEAHTVLTGRYDVLGWHVTGSDVPRLVGPAVAIGLALLVLAAIDRSLALLAVSVTYLVVTLGGVDFGWTMSPPSAWSFAPHLVIAGAILLLAATGFAVAQLRRHGAGSPAA